MNTLNYRGYFKSAKKITAINMLTLVLAGLAVVVCTVAMVRYMSASYDVLRKMGIEHPPAKWFLGNFDLSVKHGLFEMQRVFYNKYKDKKVYGWYNGRRPVMIVRDLDLVKDICVKNFNSFIDRHIIFEGEPPVHDNLLNLKGDHWRHVRTTVSPTFTSGMIKRMASHIERNAKILLENLEDFKEAKKEVELKEISSCFTLDVIASTGFGLDINTLKDPKNKFAVEARKVLSPNPILFILVFFVPELMKLFSKLGLSIMSRKSLEYLTRVVDQLIEERTKDGLKGKVNDFLDLLMNAETEEGQTSGKDLTRSEIHGQALAFILAGYDTVSTVMSFTLFFLAMNPECCQKAQAEVDAKCGKEFPDYDKVQSLAYLDMCLNEAMRLVPPGILINRVCVQDTDIQGVHFPKDMIVIIPVYAFYTDPDIFPEPETFDPERFSPENKSARHPYAHLPFGQGPRKCIGMRLALLELKIVMAAILQRFTPVPCSRSVYPIKLSKMQPKAQDDLWVKFQSRKT
ncbi:cytochrome P450 3A24-like isoform X1 [Biomphalaria glabrata]|uniref:Cytochrome P450 3A24-like isoform X1 n=2 Tax=Biomphalaria glabrata TaxID=6526 RepID=A0A9W3AIK2_BIOGL|nr:cytochrome P450 3A24-like isoform X1 [Biomphalaria glabrata]XP_055886971.1 cytochrome P450 3A24-like isoform X1 [Biomphalaria glabrata]